MFKKVFNTAKKSAKSFIKIHDHGSAAIIQIHRPEALNALNFEMFE